MYYPLRIGNSKGSLPICNPRVRNDINQPGSLPYLSRIALVQIICIIKQRERISDKGKLSERIGRKDTGLRPLKVMIASLPKNLGCLTHAFSGMSFFLENMLLLVWKEIRRLWEAGMHRTGDVGLHILKNTFASALSGKWERSCHEK